MNAQKRDDTTLLVSRQTKSRLLELMKRKFAAAHGLPYPLDESIQIKRDYDTIISELLDRAGAPGVPPVTTG